MTLPEIKARGEHAQNLLRDELLQEALRELQFAAHRAFEGAGGDAERLKMAADQLAAAKRFQMFFHRLVTAGKTAAKRIDAELQGGGFVRGIGRLSRNRDPIAEDMPWNER